MQIGLGLLGGRLGAGNARALFAIVEAGQNRAFADPVADIRVQLDQHAGNLEADLGGDARFDRSEPEHLHRHVGGDGRDVDPQRTQESRPAAVAGGEQDDEDDGKRDSAFHAHGSPHGKAY